MFSSLQVVRGFSEGDLCPLLNPTLETLRELEPYVLLSKSFRLLQWFHRYLGLQRIEETLRNICVIESSPPPRTCKFVGLHGIGELRLQLTLDGKIILNYLDGANVIT